jgi:hypothetical protein
VIEPLRVGSFCPCDSMRQRLELTPELALLYDPNAPPIKQPSSDEMARRELAAAMASTPLGLAASWFAGGVAFGTTALF